MFLFPGRLRVGFCPFLALPSACVSVFLVSGCGVALPSRFPAFVLRCLRCFAGSRLASAWLLCPCGGALVLSLCGCVFFFFVSVGAYVSSLLCRSSFCGAFLHAASVVLLRLACLLGGAVFSFIACRYACALECVSVLFLGLAFPSSVWPGGSAVLFAWCVAWPAGCSSCFRFRLWFAFLFFRVARRLGIVPPYCVLVLFSCLHLAVLAVRLPAVACIAVPFGSRSLYSQTASEPSGGFRLFGAFPFVRLILFLGKFCRFVWFRSCMGAGLVRSFVSG